MPKMIVSIDGVVIREVQVTKDRTSVGRRPYNDVVIDNLAVSGEHAVLQMSGNEVYLEDLNSTNGTFVNGKAVKKQLLNDSDMVEIGKYKIKYVNEASSGAVDKAIMSLSRAAELSSASSTPPAVGVRAKWRNHICSSVSQRPSSRCCADATGASPGFTSGTCIATLRGTSAGDKPCATAPAARTLSHLAFASACGPHPR